MDGLELVLEREVREVARDDDVIDLALRYFARDRPDEARVVDVPALQAKVRVARDALVEEAVRGDPLEREEVEIGEMSDPHGELFFS